MAAKVFKHPLEKKINKSVGKTGAGTTPIKVRTANRTEKPQVEEIVPEYRGHSRTWYPAAITVKLEY